MFDFDFKPRVKGRHIRSAQWHFHRRLYQRYGIVFREGEFSRMIDDIKQGSALLLETRQPCVRGRGRCRRPPLIEVWCVTVTRVNKLVFVLVADRAHPITCLPPRPYHNMRREILRGRRRSPSTELPLNLAGDVADVEWKRLERPVEVLTDDAKLWITHLRKVREVTCATSPIES